MSDLPWDLITHLHFSTWLIRIVKIDFPWFSLRIIIQVISYLTALRPWIVNWYHKRYFLAIKYGNYYRMITAPGTYFPHLAGFYRVGCKINLSRVITGGS